MHHIVFLLFLFSFGCGITAVIQNIFYLRKYNLDYLKLYLPFIATYNFGLMLAIIYTYILYNFDILESYAILTWVDMSVVTTLYFVGAFGIFYFVKATFSFLSRPIPKLFTLFHILFTTVLIVSSNILVATLDDILRVITFSAIDLMLSFYAMLVIFEASLHLIVEFRGERGGFVKNAADTFGYFHLVRMSVGIILGLMSTAGILTVEVFNLYYVILALVMNIGTVLITYRIVKLLVYNQKIIEPEMDLDFALVDSLSLTAREQEVLQLVCQGKENRLISDELCISYQTVKDHIYSIFQKTGVKNRVQLVNFFMELNRTRSAVH